MAVDPAHQQSVGFGVGKGLVFSSEFIVSNAALPWREGAGSGIKWN
jgi:hypothetical protein